MLKKMMLLAIAVGALVAFAAPAAAQAQQVTNANGEPGNSIAALSSNTRFETAAGTWECEEFKLASEEISTNEAATFTATGSGTANNVGGGDCTLVGAGQIIRITTIHWHIHLSMETNTASFGFKYDITTAMGPIPCEFETVGPGGAVTYTTNSDLIHVTSKLIGGPAGFGCPTTGTLSGDFTVEADGLGPAMVM